MDDPKAPPVDEAAVGETAPAESTTETGVTPAGGVGEDKSGPKDDGSGLAMRPVFLGNLRPTYTSDDIINIFEKPILPPSAEAGDYKPIAVDRLDQKRGFCFVFLKDAESQADKENVEKFVTAISGMDIDNVSGALRAEFARGDGRIKKKEEDRKKIIAPSETLFVVNFNEETTKREDLKMLFEPYGELVRIDLKRNYAFVQFSTVEEATRAKDVTNGGKLEQNILTVEYVARQRGSGGRDDRRGGGGRGGGLDRRRDDRGGDFRGGGGDRRGNYDRFDRPPPDRNDRFDDRRGGYDRYDDRRRDDRGGGGGGGGYRGRSPSLPRGGGSGGGYRSRSRSRSPPRYRDDRGGVGGYRARSPSPPRGGGGGGGGRGYDGGGGYRGRSPSPPRYDNYRDGGGRAGDRYDDRGSGRDERGYRY